MLDAADSSVVTKKLRREISFSQPVAALAQRDIIRLLERLKMTDELLDRKIPAETDAWLRRECKRQKLTRNELVL